MYFQLHDEFLKKRSKPFLQWLQAIQFPEKGKIDKAATLKLPDDKDFLLFCEFCRKMGMVFLGKMGKPTFCPFCGETSAVDSFRINISRANLLIQNSAIFGNSEFASVLIEQAIVLLITSLEIMFRKAYANLKECRHVIFGESIFQNVYSDTRNDFLNFGVTCSKFKRDLGIDLKATIGQSAFRTLSNTYYKRHVIVHNASIIDKEYISQTGCDEKLLKERLPIKLEDLKDIISKTESTARLIEDKLREAVINLIESRLLIISDASWGKMKLNGIALGKVNFPSIGKK